MILREIDFLRVYYTLYVKKLQEINWKPESSGMDSTGKDHTNPASKN